MDLFKGQESKMKFYENRITKPDTGLQESK